MLPYWANDLSHKQEYTPRVIDKFDSNLFHVLYLIFYKTFIDTSVGVLSVLWEKRTFYQPLFYFVRKATSPIWSYKNLYQYNLLHPIEIPFMIYYAKAIVMALKGFPMVSGWLIWTRILETSLEDLWYGQCHLMVVHTMISFFLFSIWSFETSWFF